MISTVKINQKSETNLNALLQLGADRRWKNKPGKLHCQTSTVFISNLINSLRINIRKPTDSDESKPERGTIAAILFIGFQYVKGSSHTDKYESLNQPVAKQSHLKHSSCLQSGNISQLCKQYLSAGYILSSDPTITTLTKRIVTDLEVILGKPWLCLLHLSASAALKEIVMKTGPCQDLILFHFVRNTTLIESEMCPFTGLYQQGCLLAQGIEP